MSYQTWTVYGYGVCISDIKTTVERLLNLASMDADVLQDVREYLDEIYPNGYKDEDLTLDDFEEFEGDYCERGVAYILCRVININEITVEFADDFDGTPYVLYTSSYPWFIRENEKSLTEKDVENIFKKYIRVLTDDPVDICYYDVSNGG